MSTKRLHILILMIVCASLSTNATTSCYLPDIGQPAVIFTCSGASNIGEAEFSLSEAKKIVFAKGNLQYQPSTKTWRIAPRQYDFVGGDNKKDNVPNGLQGTVWENGVRCSNTTKNRYNKYAGWLDTFLWGTSDWYGDDEGEDRNLDMTARKEVNPHKKVTANPYDYTGDIKAACFVLNGSGSQGFTGDYAMADWGVRNNAALGGTEDYSFRTPTKEEWDYVLNSRDNAESLRARVHIKLVGVGGAPDTLVNGLILLPDDWDPVILPETPIISDAEGNVLYANNELTVAEWQILEANGAVFLPATGSTSKYNRSGFYWSSTSNGNNAYNLEFGGYGAANSDPWLNNVTKASARAVRLVIDITSGTPPELPVVTKTCDDYAKVDVPGTGGTITSTQDESNHCIWHLTATPDEGYKFAYWTDLYGVKTFTENTDIFIDTQVNNIVMQAVFIKSSAYIHEWEADSIVYRTDTTNILHGSNRGYGALAIDNEDAFYNYIFKSDEGIWKQKMSSEFVDNIYAGNIYAGKNAHLVLFDECDKPSAVFDAIMPVMIYGDSLASNVDFHSDAQTDVTVSDGATLTINTNKTIQGFLNIQAGGKVVVNEGVELSVGGIIMRGNGITKKWPQLIVNGTISNNNNDTIYYDYTLDHRAYYPLAFPYDVTCAKVRNPINRKSTGYQAYEYSTSTRATGVTGWAEFNDLTEDHFVAGNGYIIYAAPAKWKGTRQNQAILRFPMMKAFRSANEVQKSISIVKAGSKAIDKNWNLIGNPYLANVTLDETDEETMLSGYAKWNDSSNEYELVPDEEDPDVRYITYSNNGFRTYIQSRLKGFTMSPFNCYFVQADDEASSITIALADRAASAPLRNVANSETGRQEIETGLILSQGNSTDHIGLLFGNYTDGYELNADLSKEFGEEQPMSAYSLMGTTPLAFQALPLESMARPIPLGYRKANMSPMTFSFDDSQYDRNLLDGLWLTDILTGQVTNLLVEDYTFTPESAQDDNRFYLSCERRKVVEIATDVEETTQQQTIIRVFDMFGREMHGDVNALPQGVYILMDNLGNTKKEILGQ